MSSSNVTVPDDTVGFPTSVPDPGNMFREKTASYPPSESVRVTRTVPQKPLVILNAALLFVVSPYK